MKLPRTLAALAMLLCSVSGALGSDLNHTNWSETAASNNALSPNGWRSGVTTPIQVSNIARETMAALKKWYNQANATLSSGGTANAQTLTYSVARTAYVNGDHYAFKVGAGLTNTGATTLNVSGLGAIAVQVGSSALTGGEMTAGRIVTVYYESAGPSFQLVGGKITGSLTVDVATITTAGIAKLHNVPVAVGWPATLNPNNVILANINQNSTISALIGSVEVATGSAATVSVYKASSGTACGSGTILHSGSFNANGTAATNQTLTLTETTIAAGQRICLQTTGTTSWTAGTGVGTITVFLAPTP